MVFKQKTLTVFLFSHLKKYKKFALPCLFLMLVACVIDNYNKIVLKLVVDNSSNLQSVLYYILAFIAILFLSDVFFKFGWFLFYKIPKNLTADVQTSVFNYTQNHSFGYISSTMTGDILQKIKTIGEGVDSVLNSAVSVFASVCYVIFFGVIVCIVSPYLVIPMVFFGTLYVFVSYKFGLKVKTKESEVQKISQFFNGRLTDFISNIFAIKSFAREDLTKRQMTQISHEWSQKATEINTYKMFPLAIVVAVISHAYTLTTAILLVYLKQKGKITIGDVMTVLPQSVSIMSFLRNAMNDIISIMGAFGRMNSAYEIIAKKHEVQDDLHPKTLNVSFGEIEFKNVSFQYPNSNSKIFDNFNLKISKNERKIGIVGSSGCGKTTLTKLLSRYYDVQSGSILIDGQDIKTVSQSGLHKQISIVPQDVVLFHDTIMENIRYGKLKATKEELKHAIEKSYIDDFISELPDKYNASVGERGSSLSGGQRQRIAIARAILKNAPILVLDEATSALDGESENYIKKSIDSIIEYNPQATIIAIAHRLSTLKQMDRILVLDAGKVVEDGNFNELLAKENGKFKTMWENQGANAS